MGQFTPQEDQTTLLLERVFLSTDFLGGTGYGIIVTLYLAILNVLWNQWSKGARPWYTFTYTTVLFALQTVYIGTGCRQNQLMFIDNRDFPGGPYAWFLATQNVPINVAWYALFFPMNFTCVALLVWRCFVVWSASGRTAAYIMIIFPAIMLTGSFVMGLLWCLQSTHPGLSLYSKVPLAFGTAYYAISFSLTVIITFLISGKLLYYRNKSAAAATNKHGQPYLSVAAIFIESAALYSIFAFIFLVTYAVNNPVNGVFLTLASSTEIIATYMIIYRLAEGRAWNKDVLTRLSVSNPIAFGPRDTYDDSIAPSSSVLNQDVNLFAEDKAKESSADTHEITEVRTE